MPMVACLLYSLLVSDVSQHKERVLPITTSTGATTATAFLIDKFSALTAAHAVGAERTVVFLKCGDEEVAGVVSRRGKAHDLALITLYKACNAVQPVTLASEEPEEGDAITFDGYPSGSLKHNVGKVRTYGLFAIKKQLGLGPGIFWVAMLVDGDIRPGNSGGPVFVKGKLVGVVHGYHDSTEGKPGVVVPLAAIVQFLSE